MLISSRHDAIIIKRSIWCHSIGQMRLLELEDGRILLTKKAVACLGKWFNIRRKTPRTAIVFLESMKSPKDQARLKSVKLLCC